MNKCSFLGRFVENPEVEPYDNTHCARFFLEVEEHRKDRDGSRKKRKDILEFEAWDTAATAICKQASKNDFMVVECVARKYGREDVIFRITSFRIFKNQSELNNDN